MNSRINDATMRQMSGYNCSQAVACTYSDYAGLDENTLKTITQGFGVGLGATMEGNCGAIAGAVAVLGLYNAKHEPDELSAKKKTMHDTKQLVEMFKARNREITCKELKGIETGRMLRSCKDCVRDTAEFLEKILAQNEVNK